MKREIILGDCFEYFDSINDKSVDLIFSDLPYGTTKCKWDSILPLNDYIKINNKYYYKDDYYLKMFKEGYLFEDINIKWKLESNKGLWTHYERIIKDNGCILLFGQTPFDKVLGNSNLNLLKYEWIWEKTQASGFYNAKKMAMKAHENLLVFYKNPPTYNPQKTTGHKPINKYYKKKDIQNKTEIYGKATKDIIGGGETDRYPRSVQIFSSDKQKTKLDGTIHPTQKPLALIEYFINTYTNEGDLVLDNCAGSGTVGVGCEKLNRQYIIIEKEKKYYDISVNRIKKIRNEK